MDTLKTKLTIEGNIYDAEVNFFYSPAEPPCGASGELNNAALAYPGCDEELEIVSIMLEVGNGVWASLINRYYDNVADLVLEVIHANN